MKILFLDDMKERHETVKDWFGPEHTFVHANNAAECIGLFLLHEASPFPFDLVSLDHDLVENWNGMHVVDQLISLKEQGVFTPGESLSFAIHSWNIPAAQRMKNKLEYHGFRVTQEPFSPDSFLDCLDNADSSEGG